MRTFTFWLCIVVAFINLNATFINLGMHRKDLAEQSTALVIFCAALAFVNYLGMPKKEDKDDVQD